MIIKNSQANYRSKIEEKERNNLLEKFLSNNKIEFIRKVNLSRFTHFKTGGMAKFIIYPDNIKELKIIIDFLDNKSIFYKVIGATTNLLFLDEVEYDVLVSLKKFNKIEINKEKKIVRVEAGAMLPKLVRELATEGITGFEGLEGIPGTIGGAIYMNAGAYGYEVSDNLIDVNVLTKKDGAKYFLRKDLKFAFRHSIFGEMNIGVILDARFRIKYVDRNEIAKKIKYFKENRRTYQEYKYLSLGSIFATHDLYSEIAKHHLGYRLILYFVRKLNALLKPLDNRLLNKITCRYFNLRFSKQPFSNKTMNCLINNNITSKEAIEYINTVKRLTKNNLPLENEIVQKLNLEQQNKYTRKKTKVGILTFHNEINHGSYLQCYALFRSLKNLGYNVEIINYKNFIYWLKEYKVFLVTKNIKTFINNLKKIRKFEKAYKKFELKKLLFTHREVQKKYYDVVLIGSDEVWSFNNPLLNYDPIYFGHNLNANKIVAYATSFGNSSLEDVISQDAVDGLKKFNAISVRDENSQQIIKKILGYKPEIVLDPTFLYNFKGEEIEPPYKNYILVYAAIPEQKYVEKLKEFGKKQNKKLVSIAYKNNWCDVNVIALDPFEWLGYFKNADYIITSTFHGTIYSIIYRKQFTVIPQKDKRNKIISFTNLLPFENVLTDGNLNLLLSKKIKYANIIKRIDFLRRDSIKYLTEVLN